MIVINQVCTVDSTGQKEDEDTVDETCMKNQSEDQRKNNIRELRNCRKWLNKKQKNRLNYKKLGLLFHFALFEILITTTIQKERGREKEKQSKAHNAVP